MTVINPMDGNPGLAVGDEDVSGRVGEVVARRKNGDAGAVAGSCAAVAAEGDRLEFAIGGDGHSHIVVDAAVINAGETQVYEKCTTANCEQQEAAYN